MTLSLNNCKQISFYKASLLTPAYVHHISTCCMVVMACMLAAQLAAVSWEV